MSSSSFDSPTIIDLSGKPDPFDFARRKRARYRYTEHSSSDSSDAGTFLVSNVKFRVGAPPLPPLPVQTSGSNACALVQEALGFSLNDQAKIIAKAEGVEPLSVELVSRVTSIALFKLGFSTNYNTNPLTLAGLGEDIGPECYIKLGNSGDENRVPGLGTLGCWIEIKTIREPQWTKYALTNYHVVRPAFDGFQLGTNEDDETTVLEPVKNSDLWDVDRRGMDPRFASKKADIEHPTRAKHCFAVQVLTEEIEEDPDHPDTPQCRECLSEIKSFFDNNEQHLGSIYCASGYSRRTVNDGRLDWALIKPTGTGVARIGKNSLPTRGDWESKGYITSKPRARGILKQPPTHGLRSIPNGGSIFKVGTTTGATGGLFSQIKPRVRFVEDAHVKPYMKSQHRPYLSNEFMYIGLPEPGEPWLAKKGDSGSVVFDTEGRAVGLLFRGHMAQQATSSYAYITPIEDVFADIKAFSNSQITDIRIAEDA
ncbi:hypothetical protein B0T25DRAFT_493064 [Lasiosphaeria hispida]|uniref:Peptidase S7 domain-containing protein n=1 Tax=Lasiosphaeria hispida TaxID=260671 RepID=A0AAJ0HX68_9PEZI|nr:hypothetical protein B0T25DRAFT_493064 [Lasiosphaeria hispida]